MTKVEYERKIQEILQEIANENNLLNKWKEKLDVLKEFDAKCREKAQSFEYSIQKRRRKITSIEHLVMRVKSISKYRDNMNELLNGVYYRKAKKQIEDMLDRNEKQKITLKYEINDIENRIKKLRIALEKYQYELCRCIAEENRGGE